MVDGTWDFLLDRHAVALVRERTQAMEIVERDAEITGTVFLLPDSRRFDFYPVGDDGGQAVLKGTVSPAVIRQIQEQADSEHPAIDARTLPQTPSRIEIRTRDLHERNRAPRQVHTLMRLVRPEAAGE